MAKFAELTDARDGTRILINPDRVVCFYPLTGGAKDAETDARTSIELASERGSFVRVREDSAEVLRRLCFPVMPETEGAADDVGGWRPWSGKGPTPVELGTLVDVRYRNGQEALNAPAGHHSGGASDWDHDGDPFDIVAWRLSRTENPTL